MTQGTKAPAAPTAPPNGVAGSQPPPPVNRKKQKRREKEAAKKAAEAQKQQVAPAKNGVMAAGSTAHPQPAPQYAEPELDGPPYDDEGDYYSDEDGDQYGQAYATNGHYQQQYLPPPVASSTSKKSKKKKKSMGEAPQPQYHQADAPPPPPPQPLFDDGKPIPEKDRIWNTSTNQERERIREFWLSLGEDERKSLVKIEKEAVLRKMKEQQKHSCSCSVCGRKRTAIEEELEVLYDAYYEELEHAPHHPRPVMAHPPPHEHYDDEDFSEEEEEEGDPDYDSDISEDGCSSERRSLSVPDNEFLNFGNNLQVQGGILTVADDLLKNDGKKFIEMMEQLAERRMQREEEAQLTAHAPPNMYKSPHSHTHNAPPPDEDDYDEEDEEEGYEDDDYDEDEEEEQDAMTEEQRMEEGRRMFQIFAARMFEQRVLQAYREKVAAERQQRLLEELAEEDKEEAAKEAKKAKEAAKRKEKKEKQKQARAEEKARKEAQQAAKEARAKAIEEKRQEEQRKKREEQRRKKELERKAQEEEKQRKEAERIKRQQEERDRQQEAERKAREQKAQEKKARDEAKRKEREEREAREKEAREKKAHDDKERRDQEARKKAEKERLRKEEQAAPATQNPAATAKKSSQPVAVALPPQLLKQNSSSGFPSPHVTPAVPKAPTPNKPRQTSQQGSHGSSPKTPHVAPGTSKSMSPVAQAQNPVMPKSILTKPPTSQQVPPVHHAQPTSPMPPVGPPPGMQGPPGMGMGNLPPGLNGFPHTQGSMMSGMMGGPRHNMPVFPPQPVRPFPPPGMHAPNSMPMGRGLPMEGPPGFGPVPGFGAPNQMPGFGMGMPSHSRQTSGSYDKPTGENPLSRPSAGPIQRPSSVKPHEEGREVDELASHLGSKALLDDEDDVPEPPERRTSVQQGSLRGVPLGFNFDATPQPTPFGGSSWGTPPLGFPGAPWGTSPTATMFNNNFPIHGPRANERGSSEQRIVWLRRMVCSACKLMAPRSSPDGYLDAAEVVNHINSMRGTNEPPISPQELKEACDIIPPSSDAASGTLEYKEIAPGHLSHIKLIESVGAPTPPTGLGEIGSPVPGHSVPVGGGSFGARPFPGLGPQTYQ